MPDVNLTGVPDLNNFEIIREYNMNISYSASTGQAEDTKAHGLGYLPGVIAFLDSGGEVYQPFNFLVISPAGAILEYFDCYTTTTTVAVRVTIPTGSSVYATNFTTAVKVYLFRTRANQ